jgi:hypothetical protein
MFRPSKVLAWHCVRRRYLLAALLLAALAGVVAPLQVALAAGTDQLGSASGLTLPISNDTTNTSAATRDTGEIGGGPAGNPCNFPLSGNTHSVWYKYVAASAGWVQLNSFGSSYDTVVEVFSGPASPTFGALTSQACNDDSAGGRQSAVTAQVASGTTYYIVVRSYGGGPGGTLKLSASFSSQLNIYVDQVAGSDNNPGTSALPVKTIGRAVNLAPASAASTVNVVLPGAYDETVSIGKNVTLAVPSGSVTTNAFTLQSGALIALAGAGTISAPVVNVQSGALIQQGIELAGAGGTVNVAAGTYAENLQIGKSLALKGPSVALLPVIQPASGVALTISAGTVAVSGFTFQNAATAIDITGGSGHTIYRNNIAGNTTGINSTSVTVSAAENYWGNATGPTHSGNPGGTGDQVSDNIAYRPWCTAAAPTCLPRAGAATLLRFVTSPGATQAGATFGAQPVVQAEDDAGNLDTTFNGAVTLAIKSGSGTAGATLAGTKTVNAVNGVATFTGLGINYAGQGYVLLASGGTLETGESAAFDITADRLIFSTSPGNTLAGAPFAAQPAVSAQDGFGHIDTTFTGAVTLAIKSGSGTAGATLAGTLTANAFNGTATWSGLSIDKAGTAYELTATGTGLTDGNSAAFNITAGAATQLAFTTSPGNSTAGSALTSQPVVEAQDALGNRVTSFTGAITLAIKGGTGTAGATLAGTKTVNAVAGVATFSGLSIDKVGTGYELSATAASLTGADSAAFDIQAGAPTQLVFTTSPGSATAGTAFVPQPVVEARDAGGNPVNSFTGAVTLAIKGGTGTAGATLGGTLTVNASGGVATFAGLNIDKAGTSYRLTASSAGLASADSGTFDITADAATQLVFATSPGNTAAGAAFGAQPVVEARDAFGNLDATYTGAATLAIKPGTGTAGAVLGGTLTVNAVAGVATWSGLNIDRIGTTYQLTASAAGLTGADSASFNITADRLVVTTSPSDSAAGSAFATQPLVQAVDSFGTLDTTFVSPVTLAIKSGSGTAGATLSGTKTVNAVGGVATFAGLSIDKVGTGYQLTATSGALAAGDSSTFNITAGAASQLVFTTSPGSATAGSAFAPQPVVEARDALGNLDTSFAGAIVVAIKSGTGTAGAMLAGTTTLNASGGVATFPGLSIDKSGTGYRLTASSAGLAGADSSTFNITAGAASELIFMQSPSDAQAGTSFSTQPIVAALDTFGNLASGFNGSVTLAIKGGTGTAGATLLGTTTLNATSGTATWSGLKVDKVGTSYQLTATSSGLASTDSGAFDITASGLAFTLQPVDTAAGAAIVVRVAAQDSAGTTDASFTGAVTLQLKTLTGSTRTTLYGTRTVTLVNGVADFSSSGLNVRKAGANYVLTASVNGLPPADSAPFDILPGAATKLSFATSPSSASAGAPLTLTVEAQDTYGNRATGLASAIDIAIATNPSGGTLRGTTSKVPISGLVTFGAADGMNIDRIGVGYTLRASAIGLIAADSAPFNITASRLVFVVQPVDTPVGAAIRPGPTVRAVDGFGTLDTTFSGAVTLSLTGGTSGAQLFGAQTVNATSGVASFDTSGVDRMGSGYRLTASSPALTAATSQPFDIGMARVFVPAAITPAYADLVGSFRLSKNPAAPFEPVLITVTITNTGYASAGQFWVDFYINPRNPPTAANQPWDQSCGTTRCRYGIAWYVRQSLAPGESLTLTSKSGSYYANNTDWPGYFVTGDLDLYLYVDSWNPTIPVGAVYEVNENNNRAEYHVAQPRVGLSTAPLSAGDTTTDERRQLPSMPARPARPELLP